MSFRSTPPWRWLCALFLSLLSLSVFAGTTTAFTFKAKSYSGSRDRQYKVYVPSGLSGPAPMVMALHGCQQTNDDVLNDWGLKAAADQYRFILVAPFITSYTGLRNTNCWGFWFGAEIHEGAGEVEDLRSLAIEVEGRYAIDANRRYITGLSSGGAMVVAALVAHNEYWSAGASVAGLPYAEGAAAVNFAGCGNGFPTYHSVSQIVSDVNAAKNNPYRVPLMVVHNNNDCTVLKQNALNLRDAHLKAFGAAGYDTPTTARARTGTCSPVNGNAYGCEHVYYTVDASAASRSVVETVFYSGPTATANTADTDHAHYWIGGVNGNEGKWAVKTGPSLPDITWNFFSRHPRDGSNPPPPTGAPVITLNGANPMTLTVGQVFTDPGATATDPEDGNVAVTASCSVNTAQAGTYGCTYSATDRAGNTTTATRTVVVNPTTPPPTTCPTSTASPVAHVNAGRATRGGVSLLRAITTGDKVDIGGTFDTWTQVTLYQASGGWYKNRPASCTN